MLFINIFEEEVGFVQPIEATTGIRLLGSNANTLRASSCAFQFPEIAGYNALTTIDDEVYESCLNDLRDTETSGSEYNYVHIDHTM